MDKKLQEVLQTYFKEHLSEDGIKELNVIFETAVNDAVKVKLIEETEKIQKEKETEFSKLSEDLIKTLHVYCDEATKEYMSENSVAIESNLKVEMAEKLSESIEDVFKKFNYPVEIEEDDSSLLP